MQVPGRHDSRDQVHGRSSRYFGRLTQAEFAKLPAWLQRSTISMLAILVAARGMTKDRRFDDADALLRAGLAARPGRRRLMVAFALSAHDRGLFHEGVARWTAALAAGADRSRCAACLAANLRELGEVEQAQLILDQALLHRPNDVNALTEAARLARARNRPERARDLWRRAITLTKPHPDWLQGYAQSLFALGDLDRAARVVASARRRSPDHRGLYAVEGAIAVARQDWPRAIAFWTEYRRRFPDDATGWEQLGIAVQGSELSRPESSSPIAPALARIAILQDEPMRQLMLRVESIGDSCEMGLVQRRFGAEPLGLLRWNDVALDNLIEALDHDFAGMGLPENTEIVVAANGEYFIQDRRWSLGMHTFLFAGHVDIEDVYAKMCRRIVYLRNKLLDDLGGGEKIFVYRSSDIDADGLRRLHRALRAHGPVTLLGALPVSATPMRFSEERAGDIVELDEGLYVGFLGRPGLDARGQWDIAFDDWTSICAKTLAAARQNVNA